MKNFKTLIMKKGIIISAIALLVSFVCGFLMIYLDNLWYILGQFISLFAYIGYIWYLNNIK